MLSKKYSYRSSPKVSGASATSTWFVSLCVSKGGVSPFCRRPVLSAKQRKEKKESWRNAQPESYITKEAVSFFFFFFFFFSTLLTLSTHSTTI